MNIFVLCAGRTASTALTAACQHITNYTSAHESRVGILSTKKLDYPDSHIEIDNRLIWFSHQLNAKYGDTAKYIHLKRDRIKVAKSYAERWNLNESIVKAFGHGILMKPTIRKKERMEVCLDYVNFVENNIEAFLSDKSHKLIIQTETLKDDFKILWEFIDAQGDFQQATREFDIAHNINQTSWLSKFKNAIKR